SSGGRLRRDLLIDYSPENTIADLATALAHDGEPAAVPTDNVINLDRGMRVDREQHPEAAPPALYVGEDCLDPDSTIDHSGLRHGAVVGVGDPSSMPGGEPEGLVEVRVSAGPSAGRVHRLGIGQATAGPGRH